MIAVHVERQRRELEAGRGASSLGTVRVRQRRETLLEERLRVDVDRVAFEPGAEVDRDHGCSVHSGFAHAIGSTTATRRGQPGRGSERLWEPPFGTASVRPAATLLLERLIYS